MKILAFFLVLSVIFCMELHSQDDLQYSSGVRINERIINGICFGYGRSYHNTHVPVVCEDLRCGNFGHMKGESFYAGLLFEYKLGRIGDENQGIVVKAGYKTMPGQTQKSGVVYPSLVEDPENPGEYKVQNSYTRYSLKIQYHVLSSSVTYRYVFPGTGLSLRLGPGFDFPFITNMYKSLYIVSPRNIKFRISQENLDKGYRYEDEDRRIVFCDEDIQDAGGFRLSIIAAIEYIIKLENFSIVPGFIADYGITKLREKKAPCYNDWYVHAWYAGISVLYEL